MVDQTAAGSAAKKAEHSVDATAVYWAALMVDAMVERTAGTSEYQTAGPLVVSKVDRTAAGSVEQTAARWVDATAVRWAARLADAMVAQMVGAWECRTAAETAVSLAG
jgi:hypothetical protein